MSVDDVPYYIRQRPRMNAGCHARRYVALKPCCEQCSSKDNLVRHHPDYSKPLYVITLCKSCHIQLHQKLKPVPKSKLPDNLKCPKCNGEGEENFTKHGIKLLYQRRVQQFMCKRCGHVFHN